MEFDDFVPGSLAAYQLHLASRAIQPIRQQPNEGFVSGIVHGWGTDSDAQFTPQRLADFAGGGAGLDFYGQQHAIRLPAEVSGRDHQQNAVTQGAGVSPALFSSVCWRKK